MTEENEAALGDLPRLLAEPPWELDPLRDRPAEDEPFIVAGLEPPDDRTITWADGERDRWLADRPNEPDVADWDAAARGFAKEHEWDQEGLLAWGPEELFRPLVAGWRPRSSHNGKGLVARFGADARAAMLAAGSLSSLVPFLDADVARAMAGRRFDPSSFALPDIEREWRERHGAAAVPFLLPDALGRSLRPHRAALLFLRAIAEREGTGAVVEAARGAHGDRAATALAALLATAPAGPPDAATRSEGCKRPPFPKWADPAQLPRLRLTTGEVLPDAAAKNLILLLAKAEDWNDHSGIGRAVDQAIARLDPAALAGFGWAVFEAWRANGMKGAHTWALDALGRIGDDTTVPRLVAVIGGWPGSNRQGRARDGLKVLVRIGSDEALLQLHRIAETTRYKAFGAFARRMLETVAEKRGLNAEQLADRLVPDLGLDAGGATVLDYGPRSFTVGFDEALVPYVVDGDGKRRKALPKPGAKDDQWKAPAAYKRFAAMRKEARKVASEQVRRLEQAMLAGRSWSPEEFRRFFVEQPLIGHIARRLVWTAGETAFRVAEDGTCASVEDDALEIPGDARIRIPHPVALGDAVKPWTVVFEDYAIAQPFPQLARPVLALAGEERETGELARFAGVTVPYGPILGLERSGWQRGADHVHHCDAVRALANCTAWLEFAPGIRLTDLAANPEQTITRVRLTCKDGPQAYDPLAVSEILADLTGLTGG
ncbi:DUF4132 domain-containing protein [Actinomadura violacea]|uniref:DUF4132 domain-containing protein n=1 Tax=Actinomadura violacea TaxID=2819934 RepID=A0ABS3S2Y0_9ACTN|nr:DUF4132 domain-containing protein [Actinomadura violacea]MBO2463363.1 DUF4132 domain-containing protein [Actinomadura violacea]